MIGINSRLDTLQAAVLGVKLKRLAEYTRTRQSNATRYETLFAVEGLDQYIELPKAGSTSFHVWNQYGVRVRDGRRDALKAHLQMQGIGSEIYYPIPLHQQECYAALGYARQSLPETERAAREILHLPIYPELTIDEQLSVVDAVQSFYAAQSAAKAA